MTTGDMVVGLGIEFGEVSNINSRLLKPNAPTHSELHPVTGRSRTGPLRAALGTRYPAGLSCTDAPIAILLAACGCRLSRSGSPRTAYCSKMNLHAPFHHVGRGLYPAVGPGLIMPVSLDRPHPRFFLNNNCLLKTRPIILHTSMCKEWFRVTCDV
jgi:hypothetical protein